MIPLSVYLRIRLFLNSNNVLNRNLRINFACYKVWEVVLVSRRYHRLVSITSSAVELEITVWPSQLDGWQSCSRLIKRCEGWSFRVELAQPVDLVVELILVELRGLQDDECSGPEVSVVEVGREDAVPPLSGIPPAVLTGSNSGNNSFDHLVIDGTAKQVPRR